MKFVAKAQERRKQDANMMMRGFVKIQTAKKPVMTSTMLGAHPSGCPKIYEWNRRAGEQNERDM